jgi:sterol desaturase/sphingolipid hydroxylase (fatty acid hydroxylase superfamily)
LAFAHVRAPGELLKLFLSSELSIWVLLLPFELLWPVQRLSIADRIHYFIFRYVSGRGLVIGLALALADWVSLKPGLLGALPRLELPVLALAVCVPLLADLAYYWYHRAMHSIPMLWSVHKLHHTDETLSSISSAYNHPIENVFLFIGLFVSALGYRLCLRSDSLSAGGAGGLLFLVAFVFRLQAWAMHANWRIRLSALTRVVVGPQVHRIHHSVEERHLNKNFASMFPLWDILFGTYYHPGAEEWPVTGIPGAGRPRGQLAAIAFPFADWRAARRELT